MGQKAEKTARKHLRENTATTVLARWRRPWRWLPGLPSKWFTIGAFPKLQWFFQFTMIHKVVVDSEPMKMGAIDEKDIH